MGTTRRRMRALTAFTCLAVWAAPAMSWGPEGHREIGEKAIESLRDPLKDFFEDREDTLYELLDDAAQSQEAAHFFLERYDEFPFYDVPATRELALRRFSEEQIAENGDALWRLLEAYDDLVQVFEEADWDLVLERACDVAWLVGEVGVPPNTSVASTPSSSRSLPTSCGCGTRLAFIWIGRMSSSGRCRSRRTSGWTTSPSSMRCRAAGSPATTGTTWTACGTNSVGWLER
jgi:hypothetical protein